jgi:hypothetical protein
MALQDCTSLCFSPSPPPYSIASSYFTTCSFVCTVCSSNYSYYSDLDKAANNFLSPSSLQQLCYNLQVLSNLAVKKYEVVTRFQQLLENKFTSTTFAVLMEEEELESNDGDHKDDQGLVGGMAGNDGFSNDEDAPVVVDMEDVEACLAWSSNNYATSRIDIRVDIQATYSLLVAGFSQQKTL